ncbi:hypothetical protein CHS0354_023119 [Potamilus streckersoni]|uniref:Carboxylic ester hydrolase n=1 Tax=Potamilus streckersoni TaxID=2493646 RepID=A0AAE0VH20_9BIVA|nr:hypothetical protein CHS0354_023119 [Potamilus streckersoni]
MWHKQKVEMKIYSNHAPILLMCLSLIHCLSFGSGRSKFPFEPITNTACGEVKGIRKDGAYSFRGIPYSEPPVGQLRWSPPRPLSKDRGTCWSGVLNGREFGSPCFQISISNQSTFDGSEDCLYLNVWTPTLNKMARRPVLVWVHGGSMLTGNANEFLYMPTERLSKETNVVYVGMNYRLHAFGFMALDILSTNSTTGTSGNYGIMDIIEALRWVQNNIRNFGGDPNKVTIFGQSSGGTAIFALLASALSRGLFNRAWLASASPVLNKTASEAFKDNIVFLNNTGCNDIDCLYRLSSFQVTAAVPWNVYPYWSMDDLMDLPVKGHFDGALVIIDGYVLKEAPLEAWINGNGLDVPLFIGCTAQEADLTSTINFTAFTWEDYTHAVTKSLCTFSHHIATTALKLYPPGNISPEYQYTTMISDVRICCGTDYVSYVAAKSFNSPIYRYVITGWPSQPIKAPSQEYAAQYAMHAIEIFGFFGSFGEMLEQLSLSDVKFQNNIRSEVLSFVFYGHPYTSNWLPYPSSVAELSQSTNVVTAYHPSECTFWLRNGFFSYSWIN